MNTIIETKAYKCSNCNNAYMTKQAAEKCCTPKICEDCGTEMPPKYFEVTRPYYAIIKASGVEDALRLYVEIVADDDERTLRDEMREVERDYALIAYGQAISGETGKMHPISKAIATFNDEKYGVIVVDSDLG